MIALIGPLPEHLARGTRFRLLAEVDSARAQSAFYATAGRLSLRAERAASSVYERARWAREALRRLHAETMAHGSFAGQRR